MCATPVTPAPSGSVASADSDESIVRRGRLKEDAAGSDATLSLNGSGFFMFDAAG